MKTHASRFIVDRRVWSVGVKSRSHRSVSSRSGSTDRFEIRWSAVDSVYGARSVGDMCKPVTWTSTRSCQSLLTSQHRVTRRLRHVPWRVSLQVTDVAARYSRTSRVRQLWHWHGSVYIQISPISLYLFLLNLCPICIYRYQQFQFPLQFYFYTRYIATLAEV